MSEYYGSKQLNLNIMHMIVHGGNIMHMIVHGGVTCYLTVSFGMVNQVHDIETRHRILSVSLPLGKGLLNLFG